MGRPPCLAVKSVKKDESLVYRWQVRFKFQEDYEQAKELMERWGCVVKLREQPQQPPVAPQMLQSLPKLPSVAADLMRRSGTQLHASQQLTAPHQFPQQLIRNETSLPALHLQPQRNEPGVTHSTQGMAHHHFPGPSPPSLGYSVATATGMLNTYAQPPSSPHDSVLSFASQERVPASQFHSQQQLQQQLQQQPQQQPGPLQNPHLQHLVHPYQNVQYQSPSMYHPAPSTPPGTTGFQRLNNLEQPSSSFRGFSADSSLLDDDDQLPPPRKPITYKPRTPEDKAGGDSVDDFLSFLPPLKKPTPGHPPGLMTPKKTPVKRPVPKKKTSTAKIVFIGDDHDPFEEEVKEKSTTKPKNKAKSAAAKTSTSSQNKKPMVPSIEETEFQTTEQPAKANPGGKKASIPLEKKRKRTPSQSPLQGEEGSEGKKKNEKDASIKKPEVSKKSAQKTAEKTAEELQAAAERRKAAAEKRKETLGKKKAAQELLKSAAEAIKMPQPPNETPEEKEQRQRRDIQGMMLAALEDDEFLQMCEVVATVWQQVGLANVGQGLFSPGGTGTGN
jgi:hypothetical protein